MWCCGRAASMPACSIRARSISDCRARCSCASAGSRGKRTSRRFSISICPAARSSSATGRPAPARKYPQAVFLGARQGEALAQAYAGADVFVFPSRTDTFGLVLLEALASGVPVAAFPVTGPRDVIGAAPVGALNEDLRQACLDALKLSPQDCLNFAADHTWEASARSFIENMVDLRTVDAKSEALPFAAEPPGLVA